MKLEYVAYAMYKSAEIDNIYRKEHSTKEYL